VKKVKQTLPMNQFRAQLSEGSLNEETRTVEMVWTTGSKGLRHTFFGSYYEELSLDPNAVNLSRLADGTHPLLAAHNDRSLDAVVGVVEKVWLTANEGRAIVRFAKDEISDRVFQKVKDKILRNVSVGYSVEEYTDVSNDNDEVPTYRATRWTPAELSIVPIGFDAQAKIRNQENLTENEVEIITRSEQLQEKVEMTEQEKQRLEQEKLDNAKREAAEAERVRASEIRKAVRAANFGEQMADEYIERGVSAEDAKVNIELFKKYAQEQAQNRINNTTTVEVGADEVDKKRTGIAEAALVRMDSTLFKPSQGNTFVGKSLLRNLESVIKRGPHESDTQYATRVMSSSDLPYILANLAEKSAQKKYDIAPTTWQRWAKSATLRNFKTADKVKSGDFAALQERQENGEFVKGSFSEAREQVTLKEYGVSMEFTRRMLINDDLDEISKVISQSGAAAAALENQLVYAVLSGNPNMADNVALFHADHDNLGTGGAISSTTIGEAIKLMKQQKSLDERFFLNLAPKFLICGPTEEGTARKELAPIQPAASSNVNPYSGSLELVVDPNLTANDYFFAADPSLIDTVVLYRLEGEERPRVESRTKFETESVEIKCAHSAAAKALDHRGLIKNANAS
jgi:hypothetical protein